MRKGRPSPRSTEPVDLAVESRGSWQASHSGPDWRPRWHWESHSRDDLLSWRQEAGYVRAFSPCARIHAAG